MAESPDRARTKELAAAWRMRPEYEVERLRELIADFQEWCSTERAALGAIDGYDYDSGQEYGLRRAEIEIEKRLRALGSDSVRSGEADG